MIGGKINTGVLQGKPDHDVASVVAANRGRQILPPVATDVSNGYL